MINPESENYYPSRCRQSADRRKLDQNSWWYNEPTGISVVVWIDNKCSVVFIPRKDLMK